MCQQVGASVRNLMTDSVHFWDLDTLRNRVGLFHDMFQQALRGELLKPTSHESLVDDPFYDPHMLQLVGRAIVVPRSVVKEPYTSEISVPIYSDKVRCARTA